MWLGELVTQRGIGNGMSVLIFTSVISRLPQQGTAILKQAGAAKFYTILVIALGIIVAVVFMEQGQRRIPVQYAKRVVGRRMYGGQSTYIPLKVNQAGVIPIIFAVSVLYFPQLLASTIHASWLQNFVQNQLGTRGILYMFIYGILVIFFAYFYTAITFNPTDTADNIRKYGGFIPGIRPGRPTAEYLNNILVRITQAHRLADRFEATLIGTGDIFRENVRGDTPLGREARKYMENGELVPDDVVVRMVLDRLEQPDTQNGVILDGFPRTLAQAQALENALAER